MLLKIKKHIKYSGVIDEPLGEYHAWMLANSIISIKLSNDGKIKDNHYLDAATIQCVHDSHMEITPYEYFESKNKYIDLIEKIKYDNEHCEMLTDFILSFKYKMGNEYIIFNRYILHACEMVNSEIDNHDIL